MNDKKIGKTKDNKTTKWEAILISCLLAFFVMLSVGFALTEVSPIESRWIWGSFPPRDMRVMGEFFLKYPIVPIGFFAAMGAWIAVLCWKGKSK